MLAFKACPNVLFGFRSFHHKSQLVIIIRFSLPCNWAFWSAALFFALRAMSQITYQQLIHISCGIVQAKSSLDKFTEKHFQLFYRYANYVVASPLVRRPSARRDDGLASFIILCACDIGEHTSDYAGMRFFA